MQQKLNLLSLLLLLFCSALQAQKITWATDIAPILYENCANCHRDGGLGHFSLISYDNAYNKRLGIMDATGARRMPPWMPDPSYRRFSHEQRLTEAQIKTIEDWVNQDAPAGDLSKAPPVPVFSNESEVGIPDHMLFTPNYTVPVAEDEYRCFVIPNGLTQDKFLRGLEAIPGNHEVVHHILIYEDTTGKARQLDQQTPNEPGYLGFGGPGVNGARLVGAWVPGARTQLTPPNMGIKLTKGADLIVQMHYPSGSKGKSDRTTLNLFFTPGNQNVRQVGLSPILNHVISIQNGPLTIPANTKKTFYAKFKLAQKVSFLSAAPHMHLIGRNMTCFATTPQNDTIPLIRINDWNFHWQGSYFFQKVQTLPAQSTLHAYATYDNTLNNPFQPSNPPKTVTVGEATTDEMMLVYFAFMAYMPGDENIILDSTLLQSSVLDQPRPREIADWWLSPNPTNDLTSVHFELLEQADVQLSLSDVNGRILQEMPPLKNISAGKYAEKLDLSNLLPGIYYVHIRTAANHIWTKKIAKF
jgi:Secretion system C-terminal sorting domain/Copper type II ascorbate-dependent monooxygenase, N-terminal domain/Copper type II ascorbate-dependent monooxygenase, C-terminal domain